MKLNNTLISVIMPVYNAGEFLVEAIESVRAQTYENWELLAVNDGSTDHSWELLKYMAQKDKRIRVFNLKKNMGLGAAANYAIHRARGIYLARFDADDIMPKSRLALQYAYLLQYTDTVAVGGQCMLINQKGKKIGKKMFPLQHEDIQHMAFVGMSLQGGSMMINRASLPKDFTYYSTTRDYFEDHELLFRLLMRGRSANLPQTLLYYRQHKGSSTTRIKIKKFFFSVMKLRIRAITKGLLPNVSGVVINIAEFLLVCTLPEKAIERLYFFIRITLQNSFILKKVTKNMHSLYRYKLSLRYQP